MSRNFKPAVSDRDKLTAMRSDSRIPHLSREHIGISLDRLLLNISLLCLSALLLSPATQAGPDQAQDQWVIIKTPKGDVIQAELADTMQKRAQGLMYRTTLARDRGMLFTFGDSQLWAIWMKNTRIPLDILWLDEKKTIVHIERNIPICTRVDDGCPTYQPNQNAAYVLELAAGVADELKLSRSTKLQFTLPSH
jgi:hypothetical protein